MEMKTSFRLLLVLVTMIMVTSTGPVFAMTPEDSIRVDWQQFYQKYFDISVDFTDVHIPKDPAGFRRVIIIPKGLTFAQVANAAWRDRINVNARGKDLDKYVFNNVRAADRNYAIRVRERQEPDNELMSLSANELKERGDNIITLLELLVYELKYWDETREHLNLYTWTICAGSRAAKGYVPCVRWWYNQGCTFKNGSLTVDWYIPDHTSDRFRGRAVVSK